MVPWVAEDETAEKRLSQRPAVKTGSRVRGGGKDSTGQNQGGWCGREDRAIEVSRGQESRAGGCEAPQPHQPEVGIADTPSPSEHADLLAFLF